MAELVSLARPYVRAVFRHAQQTGRLEQWSAALAALAEVLADDEIAALIGSPALGRRQLGELLAEATAPAGEDVQNLVRLLAENRRLRLVPAIREHYEALRAEAEGRIDVTIFAAAEPDEALKTALVEAVARRLARKVSARWQVDPELIGGAVVRAGDTVIDGSIAGQLERLRHRLAV